jgi:hypothetical protein
MCGGFILLWFSCADKDYRCIAQHLHSLRDATKNMADVKLLAIAPLFDGELVLRHFCTFAYLRNQFRGAL